jgi:hypothetical protein
MDKCPLKNLFGAPGTGVHQYRFMNIAVVDVLATLVASFLISKVSGYPILNVTVFMFLLGIILHRILCVRTTVDKLIFQT